MKKYFSIEQKEGESAAEIYIYGDLTSWEILDSDVSSYTLAKRIAEIQADEIRVYINSYGGEAAEGLAVYNALKRHPARIKTIVDGFACSAAVLPFVAGDERVMSASSLLMIHNTWTAAEGNAEQLRETAEALDKITQAYTTACMTVFQRSETALKAMLDAETWILPGDALEWGFATSIINEPGGGRPSQSAKRALFQRMKESMLILESKPQPEPEPEPQPKSKENQMFNFMRELSRNFEGGTTS